MIPTTYPSKSVCRICAAWRKHATLLKARAVRGKPEEGRVHHRITPGSLPVSSPSSYGASPSGLWSSVTLDTWRITLGNDVSMVTEWEPALADPSLQNHRDQHHRGTEYTIDLPKASTVHAFLQARNHLLRLMGRSR